MAVAGYAEKQNRHALSCCVVLPKSQSGTFRLPFMELHAPFSFVFDLNVLGVDMCSIYVVSVVNVPHFVPACASRRHSLPQPGLSAIKMESPFVPFSF